MEQLKKAIEQILNQFAVENVNEILKQFAMIGLQTAIMNAVSKFEEKRNVSDPR